MPAIPELQKKLLPIIYVIDSSGSMDADGNMTKVNEAIKDTMDILKAKAAENADAEILVGALKFATGAEWVFDGLLSTDDFYWNDIQAGGMTYLGDALEKLNAKMSRSAFFADKIGYKCPVLIFMSDGYPNDPGDSWRKSLEKIRQNKWFANSIKIAIAVGGDADRDVLIEVVDNNPEGLITVNDTAKLKDLIVAVSLTASKIGSVSRPQDAGNAGSEIAKIAVQGDDGLGAEVNPDNIVADPIVPDSGTSDGFDNGGFDDGGWD